MQQDLVQVGVDEHGARTGAHGRPRSRSRGPRRSRRPGCPSRRRCGPHEADRVVGDQGVEAVRIGLLGEEASGTAAPSDGRRRASSRGSSARHARMLASPGCVARAGESWRASDARTREPAGTRRAARRRAQLARPVAPRGRRLRALRPPGRPAAGGRGHRVTVFTAAYENPLDEYGRRTRPCRATSATASPTCAAAATSPSTCGRRCSCSPDGSGTSTGCSRCRTACRSWPRLFTRARVVVLVHHVHREQWPVVGPVLARIGWFLESRVAVRANRGNRYVAVSEVTRSRAGGPRGPTPATSRSPTTACRRAPVREPAPASEPPRLVVLSRLVPHKQIEHAIELMPRLLAELPGRRAAGLGSRLVGRQPGRAARASSACSDHVVFLGHVTETRSSTSSSGPGCTCCPRSRRAGASRSSRRPASARRPSPTAAPAGCRSRSSTASPACWRPTATTSPTRSRALLGDAVLRHDLGDKAQARRSTSAGTPRRALGRALFDEDRQLYAAARSRSVVGVADGPQHTLGGGRLVHGLEAFMARRACDIATTATRAPTPIENRHPRCHDRHRVPSLRSKGSAYTTAGAARRGHDRGQMRSRSRQDRVDDPDEGSPSHTAGPVPAAEVDQHELGPVVHTFPTRPPPSAGPAPGAPPAPSARPGRAVPRWHSRPRYGAADAPTAFSPATTCRAPEQVVAAAPRRGRIGAPGRAPRRWSQAKRRYGDRAARRCACRRRRLVEARRDLAPLLRVAPGPKGPEPPRQRRHGQHRAAARRRRSATGRGRAGDAHPAQAPRRAAQPQASSSANGATHFWVSRRMPPPAPHRRSLQDRPARIVVGSRASTSPTARRRPARLASRGDRRERRASSTPTGRRRDGQRQQCEQHPGAGQGRRRPSTSRRGSGATRPPRTGCRRGPRTPRRPGPRRSRWR